jgi:zinc/manganese transport system substrate-binding protein
MAAADGARLKAVATFSILADLVTQVGGEQVVVTSHNDGDAAPYAQTHSKTPPLGRGDNVTLSHRQGLA